MLRMPIWMLGLSLAACTTVPEGEAASPQASETEQVVQDGKPVTASREDMIPGGEVRGGPQPATLPGVNATRILSPDMAATLQGNSGITLQWIGWENRGQAEVMVGASGLWALSASQRGTGDSPGLLTMDGVVTEIGADYFLFDGVIAIADAPSTGRSCRADKTWRFAITQNRKYWRLREFEWCDGLTDYIDIYF